VGVGWGAYFGKHPDYPREQWRELLPLLEAGQLVPPVGAVYQLDDVCTALTDMERRRTRGTSVLRLAGL
jgi:NADPH2:quinone reductase